MQERARSKQGALVWRDGFAPGEAVLDQAVGGDENIEMAGVALDALGEADGVEEGIEGVRDMFQPAVESVFAAAIEVVLPCFEQAGGKTGPLARIVHTPLDPMHFTEGTEPSPQQSQSGPGVWLRDRVSHLCALYKMTVGASSRLPARSPIVASKRTHTPTRPHAHTPTCTHQATAH